jgi:hypothetical protein
MSVTINGTSGLTFNDASTQNTAATGFGFKNRLINSDMRIDQRNAGASVTGTTAFPVDRFAIRISGGGSGVITAQRSTTVPDGQGFVNSLLLQATTVDTSIAAAEAYWLQQKIEGFNTADFGFGAASASTVTLSFWVRSSVTGTFSTVLQNSAGNRSYVSEYTISSADTWEKKTITVTGDTSGTWLVDNGNGLSVFFCLAVGSTYQQTANSWGTTAFATGSPNQVNFMNTLNSTFYITGVQLEKGSTATSFDYRPYGTELDLCQRYYQVIQNTGAGTGSAAGDGGFIALAAFDTASAYGSLLFQQTMRASPTISLSDTPANTIALYWNGTASDCDNFVVNNTSAQRAELGFSATSNFTAGNAAWARIKVNKSVNISAEL